MPTVALFLTLLIQCFNACGQGTFEVDFEDYAVGAVPPFVKANVINGIR